MTSVNKPSAKEGEIVLGCERGREEIHVHHIHLGTKWYSMSDISNIAWTMSSSIAKQKWHLLCIIVQLFGSLRRRSSMHMHS